MLLFVIDRHLDFDVFALLLLVAVVVRAIVGRALFGLATACLWNTSRSRLASSMYIWNSATEEEPTVG